MPGNESVSLCTPDGYLWGYSLFRGLQCLFKRKASPKYDKQEDIYTDFFKQLDTAATKFNEGQDVVSNDAFTKAV
ncbi:SusD/RagB family nutrient-binding outer membrane lipoprotein [Paraflavitalea speifideaquila]|uniref:SusD/RagB family nutrient-binding outer membrane lipoprotein n=1 Tax=Paraflavitalea speifideaquila TaxID=3076558 RepID=UPI003313049C